MSIAGSGSSRSMPDSRWSTAYGTGDRPRPCRRATLDRGRRDRCRKRSSRRRWRLPRRRVTRSRSVSRRRDPALARLRAGARPRRRRRMLPGPGVRVDTAIRPGDRAADGDPMIAKILAVGADRGTAIDRLSRALDEAEVTGIQTTLPFDRHACPRSRVPRRRWPVDRLGRGAVGRRLAPSRGDGGRDVARGGDRRRGHRDRVFAHGQCGASSGVASARGLWPSRGDRPVAAMTRSRVSLAPATAHPGDAAVVVDAESAVRRRRGHRGRRGRVAGLATDDAHRGRRRWLAVFVSWSRTRTEPSCATGPAATGRTPRAVVGPGDPCHHPGKGRGRRRGRRRSGRGRSAAARRGGDERRTSPVATRRGRRAGRRRPGDTLEIGDPLLVVA